MLWERVQRSAILSWERYQDNAKRRILFMGNLSAGKFIIYAESFGKEDTNNEAPEPVRRIPQADEEKRVSKHSADALPWSADPSRGFQNMWATAKQRNRDRAINGK